MTSCTVLPLDISLQQRVLHKVAKIIWGTHILRKDLKEHISVKRKIEDLINYRDSVLSNLPEILNDYYLQLSIKNPNPVIRKIVDSIFKLQQGYYEALLWEKNYNHCLPITILNPEAAGKYEASNFIEPSGHFNDFALIKLFVTDECADELNRFEMACYYCLLDELTNIWNFMKVEGRCYPVKKFLELIHAVHCTNDLVALWAYQLENKFLEFSEKNILYAEEFHTSSLYEAIFEGHVYAAHFFWTHCTTIQKQKFIDDFDNDYFIKAVEKRRSGVLHFMYTVLSFESENARALRELFESGFIATIWACLLHSKFYECVLDVMLNSSDGIPLDIYLRVLDFLVLNIEQFKYPFEKVIFKRLWYALINMIRAPQVFKLKSCLVTNFIKFKEIDLVASIIESTEYFDRDQMLLHDCLGAGRSAINEISKTQDYDTMLQYFVSFLMSRDSSTQALTLRIDATFFLDSLRKENFINLRGIDKTVKREVHNILGILQDTLSFLDFLEINLQPEMLLIEQ